MSTYKPRATRVGVPTQLAGGDSGVKAEFTAAGWLVLQV